MMKNRFVASLTGAAVTLVLAAGVSVAGKSNDTLVWATDREIDTGDPYYNNIRETVIIGDMVLDSLLYRDPKTFAYVPLLAKSYKWVNDVTMEFELRDDVLFHNGKRFNADDVVYTFNHVASPESGVVVKNNVDWIQRAERMGDHKVRVHLHKPFPAALEFLATVTPILPRGHYDAAPVVAGKEGKPRRDHGALVPVGTGPYKIAKFVAGQSVHFEVNKNYFAGSSKGKPTIGKILFRTIRDPETQLAELLTGGLDWIWDVSRDKAEQLARAGQVQVVQAPTMRISYLAMDAKGKGGKNPFQDARVRRAINHAIDRAAIARNLVGGASQVIHAACYPSQFGCTQDVPKYDYDPEKARRLLAEAGYPNGFTIDLYGYREREYTEAVIGDLQKVGVKANLKWLQFRALRPLTHSGEAQFVHLTWGSFSINDASAITSLFFTHGKDDYAHDPEVKRWLDSADTSTDPKVRQDNYKKALVRIADQAYWAPLFTYAKYYAFSKDLDFTPTPDELPRFSAARWK